LHKLIATVNSKMAEMTTFRQYSDSSLRNSKLIAVKNEIISLGLNIMIASQIISTNNDIESLTIRNYHQILLVQPNWETRSQS